MTNNEKVKLIKERIQSSFNGVEKIESKINSKGQVVFKYHFVKYLETYPCDINEIIASGIKSSKETIKFLKGLKK